ncbi:putative bacterial glutaredoxin [Acinetobacter phage 133]|uniref:Putative bacterial glutaredoxin n=1 Tax=Acinetobacter phage 133 TaxID=2919552 RepID=D9I6G3_9CAUD|nr:putative bacterial glutaredoxin [Acinetobacter phage 133]ADJ19544.1 putative bacterial glutaredoxin [Acinetobacter phage 133]
MFTVYSAPNCGQCLQAKKYLEIKQIAHEIKTIGEDFTKDDLQKIAPGRAAFPVITYGDTLIGGYIELRKFLK